MLFTFHFNESEVDETFLLTVISVYPYIIISSHEYLLLILVLVFERSCQVLRSKDVKKCSGGSARGFFCTMPLAVKPKGAEVCSSGAKRLRRKESVRKGFAVERGWD